MKKKGNSLHPETCSSPALFTHPWIAIKLVLFFSRWFLWGLLCYKGRGRRDTSNLALFRIWWKAYEMRGKGIFISVELVLLHTSSRKCMEWFHFREGVFKRGQRCQRTPWEEWEDHSEEHDGTLLNQHSAGRDHNQAFSQGLHNYLPNKGHFYITVTRDGKWVLVILKVDWKWNVWSSTYEFINRNSSVKQGSVTIYPGRL